jgi:hypothetical protein
VILIRPSHFKEEKMGADMCLAGIPVMDITEERLEELRKIVAALPAQELPDYDAFEGQEEDIAWLRDQLRAAVDFLPKATRSREVCTLGVDDLTPYEYWFSGGLSWGDEPTDAYGHFRRLTLAEPIWRKLVEWAKSEKEGQA